jgi:diguanylate cyclase (GGDEF)-like protein
MSKPSLLVVDDESMNIKFISSILGDLYDIKVAFDGARALNILQKISIDLILLDINMPVMNGFELVNRLKSSENIKNIPFIFLTARNDDKSVIDGFRAGAVDYITKPFHKEELQVRVENHLNSIQLKKELNIKISELNLLVKELETREKNLEKFIDAQNNIVMLTDGKKLTFANRRFYDFLGFASLESFLKEHNCICELFIEDDNFFHLGKISKDDNWVDILKEMKDSQRVVSILSKEDNLVHLLSVSINRFDDNLYIVSFTNISQTILENIKFKEKSLKDSLTNSYNREYFYQNYKHFIDNCETNKKSMALVFLDIDYFKSINDNYGHAVGDIALIEFAKLIKNNLNSTIIRWGGEEFVVILEVESNKELLDRLNSLRDSINSYKFTTINSMTCSIGATIYRDSENIELTLKRADSSLYQAKRLGRDRVIIYSN